MPGPTSPAEAYGLLSDGLRRAQEAAATLSHLSGLNGDGRKAEQWLTISECMKQVQKNVQLLYTRRTQ